MPNSDLCKGTRRPWLRDVKGSCFWGLVGFGATFWPPARSHPFASHLDAPRIRLPKNLSLSRAVVLLGDKDAGKRQLVNRFVKNEFREGWQPPCELPFVTHRVELDGRQIAVQFWWHEGRYLMQTLETQYHIFFIFLQTMPFIDRSPIDKRRNSAPIALAGCIAAQTLPWYATTSATRSPSKMWSPNG